MTTRQFAVLDASRFPLVAYDKSKARGQPINALIDDFDALLSGQEDFVFQRGGSDDAKGQPPEDTRRWMMWVKENKDRFPAVCRGFILVLDADSDASLLAKQAAGMSQMLGVPVRLAGDATEAERIATE